MVATITVNIDKPIGSVAILDEAEYEQNSERLNGRQAEQIAAEQSQALQNLETQKNEMARLCRTFGRVVGELEQVQSRLLAENKKEIAKLAVEIARKVLAQKVNDGDYKIESIIVQALAGADTQGNLAVYLNPQDLEKIKAMQDAGSLPDMPGGIEFAADANLAAADCKIETSSGTVEAMIDEHLEQIAKALAQAE